MIHVHDAFLYAFSQKIQDQRIFHRTTPLVDGQINYLLEVEGMVMF